MVEYCDWGELDAMCSLKQEFKEEALAVVARHKEM